MLLKKLWKKKAVTLTELLVVIAIISLLATMAVPVYLNQMQRARVATAQSETREIAVAMQAVGVTHGFFTPIHILDNVANRDDTITGQTSTPDDFDNIENPSTRFLIDITRSLDDQAGLSQLNIGDASNNSNYRVQSLVEGWQGPFLDPQRVRFVNEDFATPGSGEIDQDLVVDPWGTPYRVYSERGLLGDAGLPNDPIEENLTISIDNLAIPNGSGLEPERFDRFAIVSYGPDRLNGDNGSAVTNPLDQGDDIFYTFSASPGNESRYRFF